MGRSSFPQRLVAASLLLVLLAGCAASRQCRSGPGVPMTLATLYFGRDKGAGGEVDEAAWRGFLAGVVTPAFPDGLTVTDGVGQWHDPASGRIVTERSKVVTIAAPASDDLGSRLDAVRAAYRRAFHQQAVGLTLAPVCASF